MGLESLDVVTVWRAFIPATDIIGAMTFLPGTQHEQVGHKDTFDKDNLLSRGQELEVTVDEAKSVLVELNPDEAFLHHVKRFHGSAPNHSLDRHIGYAIRYIATHVRQIAVMPNPDALRQRWRKALRYPPYGLLLSGLGAMENRLGVWRGWTPAFAGVTGRGERLARYSLGISSLRWQ